MTWIAVLVSLLAVAAVLWQVGKRPVRHRVRSHHDLLRLFTTFELGAATGGLLLFDHDGSGRFLQFSMVDGAQPRSSIAFGFPHAAWSHGCYTPMQTALEAAGFAVVERLGSDGMRFLDVDDLDVPRAVALTRIAWGVLGVADMAGVRARFEGPVSTLEMGRYNQRLRELEACAPRA